MAGVAVRFPPSLRRQIPGRRSEEGRSFRTQKLRRFLTILSKEDSVDDRTVKWIPWLIQAVRKGEIKFNDDARGHKLRIPYDDANRDDQWVGGDRPLFAAPWRHWCDWLNSGHPTRREIDPQKLSLQGMQDGVAKWEADMSPRGAIVRATLVLLSTLTMTAGPFVASITMS